MTIGPMSSASLHQLAKATSGQPDPAAPEVDELQSSRDLIDRVKRRSTLVGLIEPAAIAGSLAMQPTQTLQAVGNAASQAFQGDLSGAAGELQGLVKSAYNPSGAMGVVYRVGQASQALAGGLVGTLEVREGLKTRDPFQIMMGGADLAGAAASASVAVGHPAVGLGLSMACSAAKVGMVAWKPDRYTRIQKVDTMFSAAGAVSSAMLRAGVAVVPALIGNALLGPTQMLYMNSDRFRARVDRAIDWVVDHVPRRKDPGTPDPS